MVSSVIWGITAKRMQESSLFTAIPHLFSLGRRLFFYPWKPYAYYVQVWLGYYAGSGDVFDCVAEDAVSSGIAVLSSHSLPFRGI